MFVPQSCSRTRLQGFLIAVCVLLLMAVALFVSPLASDKPGDLARAVSLNPVAQGSRSKGTAANLRAAADFAGIPLAFEPNRGQTAPEVKYLARGGGYTLFLTPSAAVFSLSAAAAQDHRVSFPRRHLSAEAKRGAAPAAPATLKMQFLGASGDAVIASAGQPQGTSNYFIGNDPRNWHSGVPRYYASCVQPDLSRN